MVSITIQNNKIRKEGGVVILPLKEYQKLVASAIPTYYLHGKAAKRLDKLVEDGLREYRDGKTIAADSLTEALALYGKKSRR